MTGLDRELGELGQQRVVQPDDLQFKGGKRPNQNRFPPTPASFSPFERGTYTAVCAYSSTMVLCSACYTPFLFGVFVVVKLNTCFLTDLPQIPR